MCAHPRALPLGNTASTVISMCNHPHLYSAKCELIVMSPILLCFHMNRSSLFPLPICNLTLPHSEKAGSHHVPFIYLIVQFQYMCTVVPELLTCTLMGMNFINLRCHIPFPFLSLYRPTTHFQSCKSQDLSPTPFSEVVLHI